ncbi:molybdopterin oxidoreductase [bacterium]|nr:molybdopterin oxidoreductase [bacterium]
MGASHGSQEIRNPGKLVDAGFIRTVFTVMAALGLLLMVTAWVKDPKHFWTAFVHNHFFFMSLTVGGLFFAVIQWVTSAMWSAPIRRFAESFTAFLPIVLVSTVVMYFGLKHLYLWTDAAKVQGDLILSGKKAYLSENFFMIRLVAAVVVWFIFARIMIGNSILQDSTKDPALTSKNRTWGPLFLILFAVSFTFTSFDLLMSLDPYWFSTMFGVYCFAGLFYSTLALIAIVTIAMKRKGMLEGILNENHLHDLGKFMLAFTVFWAYIGFSQFMLIWYANMPEETGYFMHRLTPGWKGVSAFLLFGKFFLPFFILLPRANKRSEKVLWNVAWFMLVAQWIDVLWMVQPEFYDSPKVTWVELGSLIGFTGLFGLSVIRFLSKHTVVAVGDPKLPESVFHHHQ